MFRSSWLAIALTGLFALPSQAFIPLPDRNGKYSFDEDGRVTMDGRSFRHLGSVSSSGSFQAHPDVIEFLGYDPSRSWQAGDRPEDIFQFGDIKAYGLAEYSLEQLNPGIDVGSLPLSDLRILKKQTIADLVEAIPDLGEKKVREIPPLKDNLPERFHNRRLEQLLEKDVRQLRSDLIAGARQEVSSVSQAKIQQQHERLVEGYGEGVEAIAEDIIARYSIKYPELNVDLETVIDDASSTIDARLNRAAGELEARIAAHAQNTELEAIQINRLVEQEFRRYQEEAEQIVTENIERYKTNVEATISQDLSQLGLPKINITQTFTDLDGAVSDYASEVIADGKERVKQVVREELALVEQLARRVSTEIGAIKLGDYDLSGYEIDDLPGAKSTPIQEYENFEEFTISEVPGAADLNFARYPSMPQFGTGIARVDLIFSDAEKYTDRTISGSEKDGFNNTHCRKGQKGCAHIELTAVEPFFFNAGKQWVSGDSQEVRGGKRLLRGDGKEPTGRLPAPKSPLKMVLRNSDELTDTVEMFLALQICFTDPWGQEHCTPHDVLEIPAWTFRPGDTIYLGVP